MSLELLKVTEIVFSILLVVLVLLQPKDAGFGASSSGMNGAKFERRGAAKTMHILTIVIATLFVVNSVAFFLLA